MMTKTRRAPQKSQKTKGLQWEAKHRQESAKRKRRKRAAK